MKKILAVLMLAAMLLSAGCGNNAANNAKKDAQDAAQKVEEKVDEAKAKADEAAADAKAKVDEAAAEAEQKLEEVEAGAEAMREAMSEISFGGIFPGVTADEVREVYGEPVETSGEQLVFENGAIVNVDTNNNVKSIRLTTGDVETPEGVAVGMSEYVLNDAYGTADNVKQIAEGAAYEYLRGANKIAKLVFTAKNGIITEIESEFNK